MKKSILSILLGLSPFFFSAQITCGSVFTDSGGQGGQYSSGENISYLIQPDQIGYSVVLDFTAFSTEVGYDSLFIYDNNVASGTLLGAYSGQQIPTMSFVAENASGCLTVVFHSDGSTVDEGWVANVSCIVSPTCHRPTNLVVNQLTHRTASVSWTANSGETQWDLEYGPVGFAPGSGAVVTVTSMPYLIEGLEEDSTYQFYVKAKCGGGFVSSYSLPLSFKTNVNPNPPFVCGNVFTDAGGASVAYFNYSNDTTVICPTQSNQHVSLVFSVFDTEQDYDILTIYNGNSTAAPQLGAFSGSTNPGTITSTSANGCLTAVFVSDEAINGAGFTAAIQCNGPAGIEEHSSSAIELFPNPVKDQLTIEFEGNVQSLELISMDGKLLKKQTADFSKMDLRDVKSGIYIVKIISMDGLVFTEQLIKE